MLSDWARENNKYYTVEGHNVRWKGPREVWGCITPLEDVEPLNEDDMFTDLREDEKPVFIAVDRFPNCIFQPGGMDLKMPPLPRYTEVSFGQLI